MELFFRKEKGFFEEGNYKAPRTLEQISEESKKEHDKRMKVYKEKREKIDAEIKKVINSFEGAYFDEKEKELVFNKDNTLFVSLKNLPNMDKIYSVEEFKLMVVMLMFRTITKSPNGEKYLKETNKYFDSEIKMDDLKKYYANVPFQKKSKTEEELVYLIENQFDFEFKKY